MNSGARDAAQRVCLCLLSMLSYHSEHSSTAESTEGMSRFIVYVSYHSRLSYCGSPEHSTLVYIYFLIHLRDSSVGESAHSSAVGKSAVGECSK